MSYLISNPFATMACWALLSCLPCLAESTDVHIESRTAAQLRMAIPPTANGIELRGEDARWQLVITSIDEFGQESDVTHEAEITIDPAIAQVESSGYLRPLVDGSATMTFRRNEQTGSTQISVQGMTQVQPVDFHHQVVPIFTKFGCNGGGCHGKASGQGGFKLSLLGFEPEDDYERLIQESRGRRVFPAVPDQSLLLMKAVGSTPHGGGQRLDKDSQEYRTLRRWIASGSPVGNGQSRAVTGITVFPEQRRLSQGQTQQLSVWASYSDGTLEDVTRSALFESNNTDLANVNERGWVQLGSLPGDVAVMARYQGHVGVFRASIPLGGQVEEFPPTINLVDEAVFAKLKTLGIPPSSLGNDHTFIRRATLDICGRLPTVDETIEFVNSSEPNKVDRLIDRLLATEDYADFFARKWVLILRNSRKSPGRQMGSFSFHAWMRESLHQNVPYHKLVEELLTASGSIENNPAVTWWREVPDTESRVEDAAQLFLGQRLQCARCHHHPFEKWSQADYYRLAAFFSTVTQKEGSSADNPVFVSRIGPASAKHPKSGQALPPAGLDSPAPDLDPSDDPRRNLVGWMTQPTNPFFARSLVNRYWKHFMGVGLVEPEDDLRVTNPPTNAQLLDGLAEHFIDSGFDLKNLIRTICTSSTYRLSSDANESNLADTSSYSRYYPKRMQAEVLLDAIDHVMLTQTHFAEVPSGTRAVQLQDTGFPSYFLDVFGRPAGATACECERADEATLAQSLHLLNSKEIQTKLTNDTGRAASLTVSSQPLDELITEIYLTALSRSPTDSELKTALDYIAARPEKRREAFEDFIWAIVNSKEFLFNH